MQSIKQKAHLNSTYFTSCNVQAPEKKSLGFINHLADAFPHKQSPSFKRGAMQGEGVCAAFSPHQDDNYLYSNLALLSLFIIQ